MIQLSRKPEEGDTVLFTVLYDLMVREGVGEVILTTPYGARVKVSKSTNPNSLKVLPETVDVVLHDAIPVLDEEEVMTYLIQQMRLISVQDQGLGGSATPEQCWSAAKRIAIETLQKFKDLKK